ncbi:MAG: hypothetical protein QM606_10670, partial [Leucobacter sp.]
VSKTADGRGGFSEQELAKRFAPGTTHAVRMLSGSLLSSPADVQRGASLFFTVVEDLSDPVAVKKPVYPHETYKSTAKGDDAVAWVPTTADSGSSLPLTGTGWLAKDGRAGSVIDIRLEDQSGAYYRHAGTTADPHPVAADPTVWQRVHVRSTGVLDARVSLPQDVRGGSYVALRLTTTDDGTALGDVARDWTSKAITVDGAPWSEPVTEGCTAEPSQASYTLAPGMQVPAARVGGTIRLIGEDWCNVNTGLGSYVAVKINDGKINHTGDDIAQVWNAEAGKRTGDCNAQVCRDNKTIWFVIEADDRGGFDVEIPLPTRSNSHPAFTEGSYTLRLMTATLSDDPVYDGKREASRTMRTPEFTVVCETCSTELSKPGKPTAAPDPLHVTDDLKDSKRGGVRLEQHADRWTVTVPKGSPGDWVYVNVYDGATPRFPWQTGWFELDGNRRAVLPLDGVRLPTGTNKVSVQDRGGGLLGWTTATVSEADTASAGSGRGLGLSGVRFAPSSQKAAKPKPGAAPQQPVDSYRALTKANAGEVSAKLRQGELTVSLPGIPGGDWVYLFLYTERGRVVPIDWVQVGSDHTLTVELGRLPSGTHKLAFVDEDGELVGWVKVAGKQAKAQTVAEPDPDRVASAGVGGVLAAIAGAAGDDGGWTLVLIGLAVLLLAAAAVTMILLRAPVRPGPAPGSPALGTRGP